MQIQMGGWKKVYFYYGVIFFGLGLLGLLFNSRFSLPELAQYLFDDFSKELAEVGLIRSRESREVTVASPRSLVVALVCLDNNGNSKNEAINEQIKFRLEERVRVIRYVVSEKEWLESLQTRSLLRQYRFLIGLDLSENRKNADRLSVVFTIPKSMAVEFFDRLINQRPELDSFKLELISGQQNALYRLSFIDSAFSFRQLLKVIDILLDIWETAEDNLQRGNFGETLW